MFGEWEQLQDCSTSPYASSILSTAAQYGIDPNVAIAQFQQESGCRPNAVSGAGAAGLAQFMPATWLQWGSSNPADRFDPTQAIQTWGAYFRDLLDTNGGDYSLALAAYNAGQGNVNYYGGVPPFQETQNYVAKILGASGGTTQPTDSGLSISGNPFSISTDVGGTSMAAGIAGLSPLALLALGVVLVFALRGR